MSKRGATAPINEQQQEAVERILGWYESGSKQVFKLFGYAGTGKTTLAKIIERRIDDNVMYAAYTGKAVHVLRSKGCGNARTIHSLIYIPVTVLRQELDDLKDKLSREEDMGKRRELVASIRDLEDQISTPNFILNENSDLREADLLVVDEVSMVDERIAEDLLSFGVKILVLGDPAQLPPVQGSGYFMQGKPDYMLTDVERQAAKSPVLAIATGIRSGKHLMAAQKVGSSRIYLPLTEEQVLKHKQVIVGTNRTRWRLTAQWRSAEGLTGAAPMLGDRVICLANNTDLNVYNGQMFSVLEVLNKADEYVYLKLRTDDGEVRKVFSWLDGFQGLKQEDAFRARAFYERACAFMTFGHVITCHKAQGSQWRSVLVVDESRFSKQHRTNWMYTAVTRAEKRVSIVSPTQAWT